MTATDNSDAKTSGQSQGEKQEKSKTSKAKSPDFDVFSFSKLGLSDYFKPDFLPFDASKMEFPAALRTMAESALEQSKEHYGNFKTATEGSTDVAEEALEAARQGSLELQLKALDNAKANADSIYDFFKDMLRAKTVSEAVEVQTSFARKQFEMVSAQAKDMQELATAAAGDAAKPAKKAFEKTFKVD